MINKLDLKLQVNNLSDNSGCYMFYNKNNKVIYIGKAKKLKQRVISYFNKVHNFKTTQLVREIAHFEVIITNNEKEALILEHNLIKQYKPRYNILLNDDKHYPYIVITNEKDPKYMYVRNLKNKYLKSYGPFPDGAKAREILKLLEQVFPLKRCKGNLKTACLYYHLNQCSGACFQNVGHEYYQTMIKNVDQFFSGKNEATKQFLIEKMKQASDNLQFEQANRIKTILNRLDWSLNKQKVEINTDQNFDIIGIYIENDQVLVSTLFYRSGMLIAKYYEQFTFFDDINDAVREYIQQLYMRNIVPDFIIVDDNLSLDDLKLFYKDKIGYPRNNNERKLMQLAVKNSYETYMQSKLNQAIHLNREDQVLNELQQTLNLKEKPYHIEIFDISNLANQYSVGAVVVYRNGKPSRSEYRRYNLLEDLPSDYHRMIYTIERRYRSLIEKNVSLPDLVLVDGGKIQVSAAKTALNPLKVNIEIAGIVKDNHHKTDKIIDQYQNEIVINKQTALFNFLAKMQDDVHNYAISNFRKKQTKSLLTSVLETIPGLGPKRIAKLNQHFKIISNIQKADKKDLNSIIKNGNITIKLVNLLNKLDKK